MFFLVQMTREIIMHPSTFGPNLHDEIKKQLYRDIEGSVDGRYGFIITVVSVDDIPQGKVLEGGYALFTMSFRAVVFRPFRNEILDAVVTSLEPLGFWCTAGPLRIFVNKEVLIPLSVTTLYTASKAKNLFHRTFLMIFHMMEQQSPLVL